MKHKPRILFVCLGNSCRSQMAEGIARLRGAEIWEVESAGLCPATSISPLTRRVMEEKGINLDGQFPKGLDEVNLHEFDLVINMSGFEFPVKCKAPVVNWEVADPVGLPENEHRKVRDEIDRRVQDLLSSVHDLTQF